MKTGDILMRLFADPKGRIDRLLLFVFLIVNGLVLFNGIFHDPTIQYDGDAHLANIAALAHGHLATSHVSSEFFSPPLPYVLPAIAKVAGLSLWWAAKLGQMANVLLSLGVTGLLIVLCRWARPSDHNMALIALMWLGALPVYYKSMAYVRGEPYVAILTLIGIAATVSALTSGKRLFGHIILVGFCWGLLGLARQWGVLASAGLLMAVWLTALRNRSRHTIAIGLVAPVIALIVGGWFYGWLWISQGSPVAFNRTPAMGWALTNQPADFYLGTGDGRLFTDPIRPSFPNQLIPIFYAEMWGDYWGFFSIYGKDPNNGTNVVGPAFEEAVAKSPLMIETNRFTLNEYLGRVNLFGLLPTALALVAFGAAAVRLPAFSRRDAPVVLAEIVPVTAALIVLISILGYLWFLIEFPNIGKGDTIKATYMLHIFAPLALLTADMLRRVRVPPAAWAIPWGLLMIHNSLAVTTHFTDVLR